MAKGMNTTWVKQKTKRQSAHQMTAKMIQKKKEEKRLWTMNERQSENDMSINCNRTLMKDEKWCKESIELLRL